MSGEHWYYCDKCKQHKLAEQSQLTTCGIHCSCGNIIAYGTN